METVFLDPLNTLTVDKARRCFNCIATNHGCVVKYSSKRTKIRVAWHVRTGDIEMHNEKDIFYYKVWGFLKKALSNFSFPVHNIIIGTRGEQKYYSLNSTIPNATFVNNRDSLDDTLVFMNADIIIGSGSSFPLVSLLFSDLPFYFHHEPKHGFEHMNEYISNGVILTKDGDILMQDKTFLFQMKQHITDQMEYYSL